MSYSTTAYLFFGVPLTKEQADICEDSFHEIVRDGLGLVHAGDACTCEPWETFLAVIVAEDEWLQEIGKQLPKVTREQRKALMQWRKLAGTKEKPRWYLGNSGH